MLTITELKSRATLLKEIAALVTKLSETERAELATIANDRSRSQEWKKEAAAKVRETSRPALQGALERMKAAFDEVEDARPFFESPLLALARESFYPAAKGAANQGGAADDRLDAASKEATIRARLVADLQAMPLGAAQLWAIQAAQSREWAKVYAAALALSDKLPFDLSSLPIPAIEAADQALYECQVAVREAELGASELAGRRTSGQLIALGLLHQRHQEAVLRRQAGLTFTAEERAKLGIKAAQGMVDILNPQPANLGVLNPSEV